MKEHVYILKIKGFSQEDAEDFLSSRLGLAVYEEGQNIEASHLTEVGVENLNKYVLKKDKPRGYRIGEN